MNRNKKVALYLCTCHSELSEQIDFKALKKFLEQRPNVADVKIHSSICSSSGQQFLKDECRATEPDAIVVAGCTPKIYESIIRSALDESGINKYLFELANIREQCAWVHSDPKIATQKAKVIINTALSRAIELEPIDDLEVEISPRALIIGGGVAGLQVALDIANNGFETYVVEKTDKLGGRAYELSKTFPTHNCGICCIQYCRNCVLTPKLEDVMRHNNIKIFMNSEVEKIEGGLGSRYITINTPEGTQELTAGVIIIATGSKVFDPNKLPEYSYHHDDVITSLELENIMIEAREKGGILTRPSDGTQPQTVNFIQCVGSRDPVHGNLHCSLVCCTYALGQAMDIKKRFPDTNVYIHFIDLRGPYRGFEEFYEEAKEMGIVFVRGRVAEISTGKGGMILRGSDVDAGNPIEIKTDLVILSIGQEARDSSKKLAEELHLDLDIDGFVKHINPMLTPEERRGIFLAGCVQGPKGIRYSIEEAKLAASNAISLLNKKTTVIEGRVAVVDQEKCVGCGLCEEGCEFNAAKLERLEDGSLASSVDPLLCQGCGACSAGCCNKAITIRHYKREQIIPMIETALKGVLD
ncbi:MAG: CoB--CoM heterodisulfide reductase iron-sulfur subunit A family protein [Thermoplasmata archaeon]|nr:MAG: CoB--CoM heterodisulfide reductase iron-sulfur subunit A family protein [Thermoplasmata archaeon]